MAQATTNGKSEMGVKCFRDGLSLLEGPSGAFSKHETSTRVSAFAWANIPAREIGDEAAMGKYTKELEAAAALARPVGGRAPLFFFPIEKTVVDFAHLKETISKYKTHDRTSPKASSD